jgi:hypothetical protein
MKGSAIGPSNAELLMNGAFPKLLTLAAMVFLIDAPAASVKLLRTPDGGLQPQAAIDEKGAAHLIFFKGDPKKGELYYTRIGEDERFSTPIPVTTAETGPMAIGNIRGAQLAVGKNGRAHVAWMGGGKIMYYTRLNDAGTEFEPPRNLVTWAGGLDGGGTVGADAKGNVYVAWHGHPVDAKMGELGRAVFVARSSDEGKTFAREEKASGSADGTCACCGMRAYADSKANLYLLYRAADGSSRDMILLKSSDAGKSFQPAVISRWPINKCPMSSSTITELNGDLLVATEKADQVSFARVPPDKLSLARNTSAPGMGKRKHPVVLTNSKGETLFAWTENMGWAKGGSLAWQLYDADQNPQAEKGTARGVPVWSLITGYTKANGDFVIVY